MELTEQAKECTYEEYKAGFDKDMHDTTEGFVKIGYRLRMAEDTDILRESGYKSVAEFAAAEYHLTKDQVSRFININKKFSEGGYSPRLRNEYARFGFSKLAVMLTMDEEVNVAIPEQATKTEIQELSREIKAEKEISDLEVMMEQKKVELEALENTLQKAVYQMFYEHPEEKYLPVMNALRISGSEMKDMSRAVYDALAPNGYMMITFRLPGAGKWMISIKGRENPVEIVNVRFGGTDAYSFEELTEAVLLFCPAGAADAKKAWKTIFGCDFPGKGSVQQKEPEVAPVQPEPEKKILTAKEAGQKFAEKMEEKEAEQRETRKEQEKPQQEEELEYREPEKPEVMNPPEKPSQEEEQVEGQTSLEKDFSEYLPDDMQQEQEKQKEPEVAPEQREKTKKEELHEQIYKTVSKMQVKVISKKYKDAMELCRQMESLLMHMEELQDEA